MLLPAYHSRYILQQPKALRHNTLPPAGNPSGFCPALAGDLVKREATAAEVDSLAGRLAGAEAEAEEINAQEKMFGWQATKWVALSVTGNRG